ncbi:MAG: Pr6Pr family membrane protein [Bifidobacterium sp.]|nr:Pr6Pr family membrane protein [Bifidobacterium sp.]
MRILAGIWRLLIAAFGVMAIEAAWAVPGAWAHFGVQVTALAAFTMLWGAAASLIRGVHPPAWLKGAVVTYAGVTMVAAATVMPASTLASPTRVFGLDAAALMYWVVPAMVVLDFVLFDPHHRFRALDVLIWLIYPVVYVAFVVARAFVGAHGPGEHGSPYPFEFLDQSVLGWTGFGVSCLKALAALIVVGVVVCLLDRALPARSRLTAE